jgi:hypothetical protein
METKTTLFDPETNEIMCATRENKIEWAFSEKTLENEWMVFIIWNDLYSRSFDEFYSIIAKRKTPLMKNMAETIKNRIDRLLLVPITIEIADYDGQQGPGDIIEIHYDKAYR